MDLAEGVLLGARGEHEGARVLLEDAVDRFGIGGAPGAAATARLALSRTLRALGRAQEARAEARLARERLAAMGFHPAHARAREPVGATARHSQLSPRELEVLALLAEGLTNREIAERLVVSGHTVHRHVANILRKLGVPSRAAAAARATGLGVLRPPGGAT